MPRIFISYRREDSSYETTAIYEKLESHFGQDNVFMDVDAIPAGADFRRYLHEAVSRADAVLVLIGRDWLVDRKGNRRLEDPGDFVRIEVEAALERAIRVIPVLVREARMPSPEELPESIRELAFRNALPVRPGRDFRTDVSRLVGELEALPSTAPPGQVVTNSIGMKLVLIPAGEFLMGSSDSDQDALRHEKPQHRVEITLPFYLGVCTVTQVEYERVVGTNPSLFRGDPQRPVEDVSWEDAVEFCRRLSEKEGKVYRLPTEAQWEYSCRAGSTTKWCFGDSEGQLTDYAWYKGNSGGTTHPAGQKKPNAWGLYDMHGNVWEWCSYYENSPANDPKGPSSGRHRVLRGGSVASDAQRVRSAYRAHVEPGFRDRVVGFRCAQVWPGGSGK